MLKSMDTEKRGPKTCQNHQNITKMAAKIEEKLGCFLKSFLEWPLGVLGGAHFGNHFAGHFENNFRPKIEKNRKNVIQKGMQN